MERHGIGRVQGNLALGERHRFVEPAAEQGHLAEQRMRLRHTRIDLDRPFQFPLRRRFELEADHHLRGHEVRRR